MKYYCFSCMKEIENGGYCPYCRKENIPDNVVYRLTPGTILNNKYLIGNCLGEGGFGITYIGRDLTLDRRVAIKEYFPNGYASRNNSLTQNVTVTTEQQINVFQKGLHNFLEEARNIARLTDVPGIVDVKEYFEENGTAYIIMEYLDGINLSAYLKNNGVFDPAAIFTLMLPITHSLQKIHEAGIIHRDISPDNIMYLHDNRLMLTDFGSARYFSNSQKEMSVMLKQGYAPKEQYSKNGDQGPWTDVYSLCATIYKCITGRIPVDAIDRINNDTLIPPSELGIPITKPMENTLLYGLAVFKDDRCQSMTELSQLMERALANENVQAHRPEYYNDFNKTLAANGNTSYREEYERSLNNDRSYPGGAPVQGHAERPYPEQYDRYPAGDRNMPNGYPPVAPPNYVQRYGADDRQTTADSRYYTNNGYTSEPYEQQGSNKTPVIIAATVFICVLLIAGTILLLYLKFGGSGGDASDIAVETLSPATAAAVTEAPTVKELETFTPPPTEPEKPTQEPHTEPPEPTKSPMPKGIKATASGQLSQQQGHTYEPDNVLSKNGKCWCPKEGSGVNEWIRIDLGGVYSVSSVDIINGYVGDATQYKNNGKAKKIKIEFSDGYSFTTTLMAFGSDKRNTTQSITFDPVDTEYVKITILSIEEGDKFKDTCISYIHPNTD